MRILFLCIILFLPELYLYANDELTVGVFPRRNPTVTVKMFLPLINHVERETGLKIKLETAKNFPDFWKRVKQKRYDIVHYNQLHYILSKEFDYKVFAKNEEFGKSFLSPAIVVRKDSGIESISDLKDKNIIFGGGKLAMVSYVGNKLMLLENGLKKSDYQTLFARNPPNAALAVFYRRADAAGIGSIGLDIPMVKNKINTDELKYLALGDTLPHLPWAASDSMADETVKNITKVFLKLRHTSEGREILHKAGLTRIVSAIDKDYNHARIVYQQFKNGVE